MKKSMSQILDSTTFEEREMFDTWLSKLPPNWVIVVTDEPEWMLSILEKYITYFNAVFGPNFVSEGISEPNPRVKLTGDEFMKIVEYNPPVEK